jgi:hypothetical protein
VNREVQSTREHVRQLPLVSDAQASLLSTSAAKQALFEEITADVRGAAGVRRRRTIRGPVAALAGLAVLVAGGVAWATSGTTSDGGPSTGCHLGADSVSVIKPVTGDPVADCAALWKRVTGAAAPPLVAYDNGQGGIEVVAAGTAPQAGWTRRDPGARQDPAVIELDAALGDQIDGLRSGCLATAPARVVVQRELDRLALGDWSTTTERGTADGTTTCTYYYLDTAGRRVVLIPIEQSTAGGDPKLTALAGALAAHMGAGCDSVEQLTAFTRTAAAQAGIAAATLVITGVEDDSVACARADMRVGGQVEIIVRGPKGQR